MNDKCLDCGKSIKQPPKGGRRLRCVPCAVASKKRHDARWFAAHRKDNSEWQCKNKRRAKAWRKRNAERVKEYDKARLAA